MQWSLAGILGAAAGVAALAFAVRKLLPSTPLLRDVLLEPPVDADPAAAHLADLLGASGVTTTRLAPAGKARIGGTVIDVTSDGLLVEPGMGVQVVEIRGGRVIVQPTGAGA